MSQKLYLEGLRSTRIEIKGPEEQTYPVPFDLVYKRSEYVRNVIKWQYEAKAELAIDFSDVPASTLEALVVWIYSGNPTIRTDATCEDVVELAIFADKYFFEALHNQALDILCQKFGNGGWRLQPHIVRRVYQELDSDVPLRKFIRVILNNATRGGRTAEARQEVNAWKMVFESSPEIGRDYYEAICEGYGVSQVLSGGPCRYHWHRDPYRQDIHRTGDVACPFDQTGCFLDWEKYAVSEDLANRLLEQTIITSKEKKTVGQEASTQSSEQPKTIEGVPSKRENVSAGK